MDKILFIATFREKLIAILTKRAQDALTSNAVELCVLALEKALASILGQNGKTVTEKHLEALKQETGVFYKEIDNLASARKIRGKAAYYSKTTLNFINVNSLNFGKDKKTTSDNGDKKATSDNGDKKSTSERADKKSSSDKATHHTKSSFIDIFKETIRISEASEKGLDKKITQDMIKGTVAFRSRKNGDLRSFHGQTKQIISRPSAQQASTGDDSKTQYEIVNLDSFVAAKMLIDQGFNPLVLNMANSISVGGGVVEGTTAQEECLMRCSDYYLALRLLGVLQNEGNHAGRLHYKRKIAEFGSIYTPLVQVFRNASQNYEFIKPFTVSCLALAGYNLSKPHLLEDNLKGPNKSELSREELMAKFKEYTKVKFEHLCEVAILYEHDSLLLGALSCGAFCAIWDNPEQIKNAGVTARAVAEAAYEVLQSPRYRGRFKNITFAVLDMGKKGKINFDVFEGLVKKLNAQKTSQKLLQFSNSVSPNKSVSNSASNKADNKSNKDTKTKEESKKDKNKSEAIVDRMYSIFENDLKFFTKLPAGVDVGNVMVVVRNALSECIHSDDYDSKLFCDNVGGDKNKQKLVLQQFEEALPKAEGIFFGALSAPNNKQSAPKPPGGPSLAFS